MLVVVLVVLAIVALLAPRRSNNDAASLVGMVVALVLVLWALGLIRAR